MAFINGVGPRVGEFRPRLDPGLSPTPRRTRTSRSRASVIPTQGALRPAQCVAAYCRDRRHDRYSRRPHPGPCKTGDAAGVSLWRLGLIAGTPASARRTHRVSLTRASTSRWRRPGSIRPRRPGIITPFMVLYALHDAMVKPMPGKPADAVPRRVLHGLSPDGLSHDFVLRDGAKFHNGEPVTAEDVKFSFERYRGTPHGLMQEQRGGDRDARSAARPLQAQQAVARFSDLLFAAPPAPAGSCRRNTSRRSATTASRRRRSAPAPTNSSRSRPASSWCSRPSTTIGARPRA